MYSFSTKERDGNKVSGRKSLISAFFEEKRARPSQLALRASRRELSQKLEEFLL